MINYKLIEVILFFWGIIEVAYKKHNKLAGKKTYI